MGHDLVIRSGTIVDGTGADSFTGDLAIDEGVITQVGGDVGQGSREIDADGAVVAPGWVDIHTHYDGQVTWVFALPGNPVSCLVTHEVFVRPALARIGGCEPEVEERAALGVWKGRDTRSNPRQQNLPVLVEQSAAGVTELSMIRWNSSADVVALTTAQGLVVVPPNEVVREGDVVRYRPLA